MVVLICISLMAINGKHLFMCLFAICVSSPVKCVFMLFAHFLITLFELLLLRFEISLWNMWLANIFLPGCSLSFYPLHESFCKNKIF